MRQDHSIARSQIWSERDLLRVELASLINERPEIWTKGLNGDDLSESKTAQFEAMFTVYLFKEATHYNQRFTGISPGSLEAIANRFARMIMTYPGLKTVWSRWLASRAGPTPFARAVEQQLDGMTAGQIEYIEVEMVVPF